MNKKTEEKIGSATPEEKCVGNISIWRQIERKQKKDQRGLI